ncbi:MAG: thioredoxin family protein [Planctomycetota bacterium]
MGNSVTNFALALVVAGGSFLGLKAYNASDRGGSGGGNAPAWISHAEDLGTAIERSKAEGKPVFVVTSASWCPPCRQYKKGALSDPSVTAFLQENAIPVYVDVDQHPDHAQALKVRSIPTTFVLNGDEVVERRGGVLGSGEIRSIVLAAGG